MPRLSFRDVSQPWLRVAVLGVVVSSSAMFAACDVGDAAQPSLALPTASGPDPDAIPPDTMPKFVAAPGRVRRLLTHQYTNAVRDLLGDNAAESAAPPPDSALLDQAESGKLAAAESVREVAKGMIEKPAAKAALATFYSEVLKLRDVPDINKDKTAYPKYSRALGAAMQQETLLLIDDLVWKRDTDIRELFNANYTFVNGDLAKLYGLEPPGNPTSFEKRTLDPEGKRAGFLAQGSFLTRFAHFAVTSPTLRGKFVIETVLCGSIAPPPPGVMTNLPDLDPKVPTTMRMRLEKHRTNPSCSSCHARMDGIGLALENFDAIGEFRTVENTLTIDTKSTSPELGDFSNSLELGKRLVAEPDVARCIVRNMFRNSMGHFETPGEDLALAALDTSFDKSKYRIKELMVNIVTSPAFLKVGDPR